jgi:CheY-like chemotaxis protein
MPAQRLLVVEDELLVALDIESILTEAGMEVVGPASTAAEALQLIGSTKLDAALLDANLSGEPIDEVASALSAKGVPFAYVTGYGRESLPEAHPGADRHQAVRCRPASCRGAPTAWRRWRIGQRSVRPAWLMTEIRAWRMIDRFKLALAQLNPTVGAVEANLAEARTARARAAHDGADLVLFSELLHLGLPARGPGGETELRRRLPACG